MPKTINPNAIHYFIMKILSKIELQQIAPNHLPNSEFQDLMKVYVIIKININIYRKSNSAYRFTKLANEFHEYKKVHLLKQNVFV